MSETKTREPLVFSPLEDEPAIENLPEPIPPTPEQLAAQAEANEQEEQRQLEWAMILRALSDNAMAVTREMRPWYPREGDRERQIERIWRAMRMARSLSIGSAQRVSSTRTSSWFCSIFGAGSSTNMAEARRR